MSKQELINKIFKTLDKLKKNHYSPDGHIILTLDWLQEKEYNILNVIYKLNYFDMDIRTSFLRGYIIRPVGNMIELSNQYYSKDGENYS